MRRVGIVDFNQQLDQYFSVLGADGLIERVEQPGGEQPLIQRHSFILAARHG